MTNDQKKLEWTIKELSSSPKFPYKERMIRHYIKEGKLKDQYHGYQKITIPDEEVQNFLKMRKKAKKPALKKSKSKKV